MSLRRLDDMLKYANHSRLTSQHKLERPGGGGDDHLLGTRIFTLTMNKIFILSPKIMRQKATGTIRIC